MKKLLAITAVLTCLGFNSNAQEATDNVLLFKEIHAMDSLLFTAFNNRDLEVLAQVFSEDLEFYHDKGGLTNYAQNMDLFKTNFDNPNWPKRELIAESMEVYPVPGYGAIQSASHRFCHLENGQMACADFKFVHIWKKKDSSWKLTRIVSFDH